MMNQPPLYQDLFLVVAQLQLKRRYTALNEAAIGLGYENIEDLMDKTRPDHA